MAAPETGGSENGAGRNTLPGTKGQVEFLREPRPSPSPPGLSALAIGGNCPSITSRGGLLRRSLRQRRQQSDGCESRMRWSYIGPGRSPCQACYVPQVLCAHFSMFLQDSSSKALEFRTHHTVPLHLATVNCATKEPRTGGYLCKKRKPFFVAERTRNHPSKPLNLWLLCLRGIRKTAWHETFLFLILNSPSHYLTFKNRY